MNNVLDMPYIEALLLLLLLNDNPLFSEVGAGAPVHWAYQWTMPHIVPEGDL